MAMHGTQRRAVLATTVTMLSACGLAWAAAMPTPPQTAVPPAVQFIANPAPMTDFTAPTIAGAVLNTSDLRGKVVLVNFWATWCPPCVTEVPDLVRLQTKYEGRLVVVGVADDHGAVDVVQNFASAKQVHYPLVMNTPALAASFPGLIGLPTTYVIDQGGRIVKKHIGQLRIDRVEAEVDALLAGRVEPR
jgi:thiol-disulfide isomerase/thioredoxin